MGVATGRVRVVRPLDVGWVDLVVVYPLLLFVAFLLGFVAARILDAFTAPSGTRSGASR